MITAYFDDSGSHDESKFITYAAVIGSSEQWSEYEQRMSRLLANPVLNRERVSRFHMAELQNRSEQFADWSRTECDHFIVNFRQIILDIGLWGAGVALDQHSWNEEFSASAQKGGGTAEQACIAHLLGFVRFISESKFKTNEISLVFDNRSADTNAEIISSITSSPMKNFEVVSVSFADLRRVTALQAADMLAWEYGNLARNYTKKEGFRPRPELKRIIESGRFKFIRICENAIRIKYSLPNRMAQAIIILPSDSPEVVDEKISEAAERVFNFVPFKKARQIRKEAKKADRKLKKHQNLGPSSLSEEES